MAQGIFNLKQVNQAIRQGVWKVFNSPKWVEYLVVAGGGGGGSEAGGGAGGLLTGTVPVTDGASYSVTVGGGGAAHTIGVDSVFGSITSKGGGNAVSGGLIGISGGSGAGTGANSVSNGGGAFGGQGIAGQGNAGGGGASGLFNSAGGGGGAGKAGGNALTGLAGNGGAGIASAISGSVVTYAGGGGGGAYTAIAGSGGVGGGGSGGTGAGAGGSGSSNTGGGGGGAWSAPFGIGGSGIVIVRYPGTVQFYTGGTVNYANGYIVHTFYSNGTLAPTTPTQYSSTYQISRSIRLNKPDLAFFSRTVGGSGNRKTWTWSGWVKRTSINTSNIETPAIFLSSDNSTGTGKFVFGSYGSVADSLVWDDSSGTTDNVETSAVFRDLSAWYHIVLAHDSTQLNSTDRVKIYVNGVRQAVTAGSTYPVLNKDTYINYSSFTHRIGAYSGAGQGYQLNAYLAEINFIDGQQLTPSSFGEYDVNTGVWIPRAYGGSYGTNGFKLNFSDNSNITAATLGADSSGNGNNWTPNNFSVTAGVTNDSFVDTPTQYGTDTGVGGEVRGNYCTLNPLDVAGTPTISEGNLKIVNTNADAVVRGTFGIPGNSGKWYFEITQQTAIGQQGQSPIVYGMATLQSPVSHSAAVIRKAAYYYTDYIGRYLLIYVNGATAATISVATAIAINEVLQFAYDSDTGKVWIGKGGVWSDSSGGTTGNPATGANATYTFASVDEPMTPTFDHAGVDFTASLNCGQRPFVNTAPSGFTALCTTNLPTPTIGATATTQANKYFNPVTYTGAGGTQAVNVGFQPDFVWMKSRSNSSTSHILQNAVTGVTKGLQSNSTDPEFTDNTTLTEFNSAGFKVGGNSQTNLSATTYVAWNWKANGAGVTNTDGSITSTVSANPTAGFSIVTYASTTGTVGHGLGVVPSVIIMKGRNVTDQWAVYHISMGNTYAIPLNSTGAGDINSSFWNNTTPTSTVFSQGSWDSGYNKVAYCFAPIAGYSAFGKYTGTGSGDGPFVYTGFRPAFLLIKRTDTTNSWIIYDSARDTFNVAGKELLPDSTAAEASYTILDFLSNGIKLRTNAVSVNAFGGIYIYMAFASNPFKYSLAR